MAIPALVLPKKTYESLDEAHSQLLTLVYPMSHYNVHKHSDSTSPGRYYFKCARITSTGSREVSKCPVSVVANQRDIDSRWTLTIIRAEHNHEKGPKREPPKNTVLWKVLQDLRQFLCLSTQCGKLNNVETPVPQGEMTPPQRATTLLVRHLQFDSLERIVYA